MTSRFKAAPDGLIAAVLLSFLATAGIFYVNIMAALVDGLQGGLGFSPKDAGFVSSANVYGAAVGAFLAVFTVKRLPWRQVAIAVLIGMIVIDFASMFVMQPLPLIGLRALHGLLGGFLVGTAYGVIARVKTPDRVFGMLLIVQFLLGGLGLLVLPRLVPIFGAPALFAALALFSGTTLLLLAFLDDYPRKPETPLVAGEAASRVLAGRILLLAAALIGVFLFQVSNMGVAAYIIGLGRQAGLDTNNVSATLAIANWIGALGSALVVVMGLRFGRFWPILAGMVVTIAGTAIFLRSDIPGAYALANVVTSITWSFVIAYLLGLCAAFDGAGRGAALAGFFSKMGLASGPALAGLLLQAHGYSTLVTLSLVGLAACTLAVAWPAWRLDRQGPSAPA